MKVLSIFIVVTIIAMSQSLPGEEGRDLKDVAAQFNDVAAQIDGLDAKLKTNQLTRSEKLLEFMVLSKLIKVQKRKKENRRSNYGYEASSILEILAWNELSNSEYAEAEAKMREYKHQIEQLDKELEVLALYEKALQDMQAQDGRCPSRCTDNPDGTLTCDMPPATDPFGV